MTVLMTTSPSTETPGFDTHSFDTPDGSTLAGGTEVEVTPAAPVRLSADETSAMIERNLPLVQHVLYQVAAHYPRHADREELAQAATLGLVEAAHRYDPSRGVPFERWAAVRVRGAIVDAARALDFAPRSLRAAAREVEEAQSALLNKLGRTPSATELANHLNISGRELAELQGKVHRALVLSLDAPCGEEDGDPLTLADGLIETSDVDPSMQIEDREQAAYLRDALELLPDRLQVVVKGYFLEGRTSADLAEQLSVTESRVSQMRSEGLALMRAGLQAQFDDSDGSRPTGAGHRESSRAAARKAAYSAALATHSSYVGRLGRRIPAQRTSALARAV